MSKMKRISNRSLDWNKCTPSPFIKVLQKAPSLMKEKSLQCFLHLTKSGLHNFPYPLAPLQVKYIKIKYLEIKLNDAFFIRYAGTPDSLGTG